MIMPFFNLYRCVTRLKLEVYFGRNFFSLDFPMKKYHRMIRMVEPFSSYFSRYLELYFK